MTKWSMRSVLVIQEENKLGLSAETQERVLILIPATLGNCMEP